MAVWLALAMLVCAGCRLNLSRSGKVAVATTVAAPVDAPETTSTPSSIAESIRATAPLAAATTDPPLPAASHEAPSRFGKPTVTPTPSPLPTAPPTPTPTPTPTVPPSVRLATGIRYQLNGDTANARREFALLISANPTGPEAHEALYRLAETYLTDGAYDEAVAALLGYLEAAPPDDLRRTWARFLLAHAYEGAGAWDAAIAAYEEYLKGSPLLTNEVRERIAKAQTTKGDLDAAISTYVDLLKAAPPAAVGRWRESLALLYMMKGETDRALAQYDTLLNAGPSSSRRAQLHLLAAQALDAAGRKSEAQTRRLRAVEAEPRSSAAYTALVALVDAGVPVDDYLRGLTDYYAAAYGPAVTALRRYISSDATGRKGEAHYFLAKTYAAQNQLTQAIAQFDVVINNYTQIGQWGDAWLDKASAQARAGNATAARTTYRRFATGYPTHRLASQALWRAALLLENAQDYRGAARDFLALRQTLPASADAAPALLRAGVHLYRVGDYKDAASAFQDLATNYASSDLRAAALFWWGKSLLAAGDMAGASVPWSQLRDREPNGFYSLRAEALGATPVPPPPPPPDDQEAAEAWLRGWTQETATDEALRALPTAIADDPAYRRGREMLAVGLVREGLAELEGVKNRWNNDPVMLYRLSLAFRDLRANRLSVTSAMRLIALSPAGSDVRQAPGFILRLSFPRYYADLVEPEAAAQKIDVWLFYALIRQESLFEETSTSVADALGLTQVIPSTGEWIAGRIGWRNFYPEQLYRPYVGIKFGAYYLGRALVGFSGDRLMALAGYNGGPGNAQAWRRRSGPDDDLFVADIGARESQIYVRSVMSQQAIYRWLYGGG
ncbi:MAG: tetratricopeptide repeat protein [Anaerolineae bacterium]|nr:tetratricopeptide repeat protein [Anaerolineae bacterium]